MRRQEENVATHTADGLGAVAAAVADPPVENVRRQRGDDGADTVACCSMDWVDESHGLEQNWMYYWKAPQHRVVLAALQA